MNSNTKSPDDFDPFSRATIDDPFPFFEVLRAQAPVYEIEKAGYFMLTRYADIKKAVLDPDTFSSNLVAVVMEDLSGEGPSVLDFTTGVPRPADVLAIADPPEHTRQRKLVNKAFSYKRVASLEPMIRAIVDEYYSKLQDAELEYMASFALPLPMRVICELVGFDHADAAQLRKWSDESMDLLSGINTQETFARNIRSASALSEYLRDCFEREKEHPGDHVLGDLVRATQGGTEVLSDDEVASILVQLATAGQETTGSLIGSAVMRLAQDQNLQSFLRENPDRIPDFIEEAVRLESPFYGHFRVLHRDTEVAGVPLPKGTRVMLAWSSANRDAAQFERPDEIDLDRSNKRTHMGFGMGIHMCIGAPLARLEAQVAVEKLLASTARVELAQPEVPLRHVQSLFLRRLESLPLRLHAN